MSWRDSAQDVIRKVFAENMDASNHELKQLLSKAYPFGLRENYPYKVWCQEVGRALGKKKAKPSDVDGSAPLFE